MVFIGGKRTFWYSTALFNTEDFYIVLSSLGPDLLYIMYKGRRNYHLSALLILKFALNKSSGKISAKHILLPSDWLECQRFSFLLWANQLGLRAFFFFRTSGPLSLLWANWLGFESIHNLWIPVTLLEQGEWVLAGLFN